MAQTNTVQSIPGVYELPGMVISPSGGSVRFVGTAANVAALGQVGEAIASRVSSTPQLALAGDIVSGRGDYIYLLPGYTANVDSADWLSNLGSNSDVTICGLGHGTNKATLTWTTAGSTLLMDAPNFRIVNTRMFLAGAHAAGSALTVAAPITISAAGWDLSDNEMYWGFDADQIVAIGIATTLAADNGKFNRVYAYANAAAVPTTTFLRLTGTDYFECDGSMVIGPGSTVAIGPVQQLTTASLGVKITRSVFQNTLANSTHSFTAIAGCTGIMDQCSLGVLAAGNGITTGSGIQVTGTYVAVAGAAGTLATG